MNRPLGSSPNDTYSRPDRTEAMSGNNGEPPTKMRKVLLQTMGQQLREVGLMRNSPGENAVNFGGNPNGLYFIRSVYGALAADRVLQTQAQTQSPESDVVPGEDDQLPTGATKSASKYLWQPNEVLAIPASNGSGAFSFDDLLDWSRSYFDNWHPAYPFLHAPSLLEYFDHIVQNGVSNLDNASSFQLTILRSIMSISLTDRRQTGTHSRPIPANLVFDSFNHAIDSIQRVLTDESSIQSLQVVVSVQLFLLSMLRYNAASRFEGLAVRMAFHLGLHRCPMRLSTFLGKEAELRKRLFWSIYCIDRYICSRLGLPLGIRDDDIDVCYPGSEKHIEGTHDLPNRDDRLDLLDFLARQAGIRGSIMELRNKSSSHNQTETDQAVAINSELSKWWNEVDEYLESNGSQSTSISRFHQVTLVILRYESIIALNRSILATSKKSTAYNAALQNCIGASRSVINTLHKAMKSWGILQDSPAAREVPENTPLLWPSFTWAVWMSAFIMIYAANEGETSQDVAIKLADRSLEILNNLTLRGSVWPDACAVAIRQLRVQLIDGSDQSKNNNAYNGRRTNATQNERLRQTPQRTTPLRDEVGHDDLRSTPSNPMRSQQPQHTEISPFRTDHDIPQERHDPAHTAGNSVNLQEFPDTSFSHIPNSLNGSDHRLDNLSSGTSFSGPSRQNFTFSDLSNFAVSQWNMPGIGQQLSGIPMLNDGGTDLFYSTDIPFWMGDDQWQGFGGSHSA